MAILRTDIERALNELSSQEEGMRFQGLAVVLGKKRWPELIAHQRKKDFGLDAYAPPSLAPDKVGKGLAASITSTLKKVFDDAETAKKNFPDLKTLLFVTAAKVGNAEQRRWKEEIQKNHGLELHIIEREEIITLMMMPENASLRASFLHIHFDAGPQVADLIDRTRRAADAVTQTWAGKTKGHPLIDLTAVRLDPSGAKTSEVTSLDQIDQALSQSGRIVLEGPAGRGKTTKLIQLAQRSRSAGMPFIVELPAWTSSRRGILDFIAGMPAFQAEGLSAADLARVQHTEPFLFLLNGWNEIAESNSAQASNALRDLERDFPSAGIIVATRTHHLTPPLPGALRLRLLRLSREQRSAYLTARLGVNGAELQSRINADSILDELTRTPFILSEVASLFEAGAEIPSTKIDVLTEVLRLQERREEHRNALQSAPIFGRQTDYLKALATEMTCRGAVALHEADSRAVIAAITRKLAYLGQIEPVGAPPVLSTLTAHHILELVEYPQAAFQFEHQQLQEYYAALDVRAQLLDLGDDDRRATGRFTAKYVNNPAWAEPLRMIAETFSVLTGDGETDKRNTRIGGKLVEMALSVDPVFAGELAQLCGPAVWKEVRLAVGERLRSLYAIHAGSFKQYALTAMLATGAEEFSDIIVPLLSSQDQQVRLRTYRLWPDIQVSSLGPNWREQVRGWSDELRTDFVSELLHHRVDREIAAFAAEDDSIAVKTAAASGLMWTGSEDLLTLVLESMDAQTFEDVARQNADLMPAALRLRTVAVMRKFIERTTDHYARLQAALDLIDLGETGLDDIIKDAMTGLGKDDIRNHGSHHVLSTLTYLRKIDPAWVSEWIAIQVAEGVLPHYETWLPFITTPPKGLAEKYLRRFETEDLKKMNYEHIAAAIAVCADEELAAHIFAKLREKWRKVDIESGQRHEFEWQIIRQLESVYRLLPDDIAAAGILSSVTAGTPLDIKVAANLLSRVARADKEPLRISDIELGERLRAYLKNSVDLVLCQDDFSGEEKANLASSISQVGKPEDMRDLATVIRADIDRRRRGRAAWMAGDRGPLGNGGMMDYANWNIASVMHLDPTSADQVLIDLLSEPEYLTEVASAMARDFIPRSKSEHPLGGTFPSGLNWAASENQTPPPADEQRRKRFAEAINAEIKRLRNLSPGEKPAAGLKELAKSLAAIDGRNSATVVLDVIATPGQWDKHIRLDAAELLLIAGVILPSIAVFDLIDSIMEQIENWMQESDKYLLERALALCPFIDDPEAGIAKIREVLRKRWLGRPCKLVTALGKSRSDAAIDLLVELASDARIFDQCEDKFISATAALDTPSAHELLLGFVDPDIQGIVLKRPLRREDLLIARLTDLAQRRPEVGLRLRQLCDRDLPEFNRRILSKVMAWLGTPETLSASLSLIDDANPSPIPEGVWDQLKSAFVERKDHEQTSNAYTQYARASNELRVQLFRIATSDDRRRKSALKLLGEIEEWRLELGRPADEPRHPDLASGQCWPPKEV